MFGSLVELQVSINRFLAETNANPKPFVWTANPDHIIEKVRRGNQALGAVHYLKKVLQALGVEGSGSGFGPAH